jgi:hypothetical protein
MVIGIGPGRRRDRRPDRRVRHGEVLRDVVISIAGAGRKTAWVRQPERRDATSISPADLGARKTSQGLLVRPAERKVIGIVPGRRRERRPDQWVRHGEVLRAPDSTNHGGRKRARDRQRVPILRVRREIPA